MRTKEQYSKNRMLDSIYNNDVNSDCDVTACSFYCDVISNFPQQI
jgi:hypothetical protein